MTAGREWDAGMKQFARFGLGLVMGAASPAANSEQVITIGAGMKTCAVFLAHYKGSNAFARTFLLLLGSRIHVGIECRGQQGRRKPRASRFERHAGGSAIALHSRFL